MSRQVGTTILVALSLMAWFPSASNAQDASASGGKRPGKEPNAPYRPRQVSQEFLSRLFPVKGRMYGDRHALPTRSWSPLDSRPIEQFEDKEAAQENCWNICAGFLKDGRDLQKFGLAFVYFPPDDFDRKRWGGGGNNPDRLGRHVLNFKRNDIYVTVVIQEDMIAFTFEYKVGPKEPEPPLAEIQKKIAAICPFLGDIVLEKITPEEDNAGWAKAGLGVADAKNPQQFDRDWVKSVRWWREPGRFGVASTTYNRNISTGRVFRAPYTGD